MAIFVKYKKKSKIKNCVRIGMIREYTQKLRSNLNYSLIQLSNATIKCQKLMLVVFPY